MDSVIGELSWSIIGCLVFPIGQGDIGPDVCVFDGFDVLERSILGIAGDVSGPHMPAKIDVPEQVEHGLVVHHLPRRHQHCENDAALPPSTT